MAELTILIAEDDQPLARLWKTAFKEMGHEVIIAGDGKVAIDWLETNPLPDAIIVDYNMPKANGIEVLQALEQINDAAQVAKIMITANHTLLTDEVEAQVDMFLVKPVGYRDMLTLVERLSQQKLD